MPVQSSMAIRAAGCDDGAMKQTSFASAECAGKKRQTTPRALLGQDERGGAMVAAWGADRAALPQERQAGPIARWCAAPAHVLPARQPRIAAQRPWRSSAKKSQKRGGINAVSPRQRQRRSLSEILPPHRLPSALQWFHASVSRCEKRDNAKCVCGNVKLPNNGRKML